jgi:hypothetical protein
MEDVLSEAQERNMEEFWSLVGQTSLFRGDPGHPGFKQLRIVLDVLLERREPEHLQDLFVAIAYTRDILGGRGERLTTYMMLEVWHKHFPELACAAFDILVKRHSYGSWRDAVDLSQYLYLPCPDKPAMPDHPLIAHAVQRVNEQLRRDTTKEGGIDSNVAKWIPRETARRHRWFLDRLVLHWFQQRCCRRPWTECLRQYRQLVSKCTKRILGEALNPDSRALGMRCGFRALESWTKRAALLVRKNNVQQESEIDVVKLERQVLEEAALNREWYVMSCKLARRQHENIKELFIPIVYIEPQERARDVLYHALAEAIWIVDHNDPQGFVVATTPPVWISCLPSGTSLVCQMRHILQQFDERRFWQMRLEPALRWVLHTSLLFPTQQLQIVVVGHPGDRNGKPNDLYPRYNLMRETFNSFN